MLQKASDLSIDQLLTKFKKAKSYKIRARRAYDIAYKSYRVGTIDIAQQYVEIALGLSSDYYFEDIYIDSLILSGAIYLRNDELHKAQKALLSAYHIAYDKKLFKNFTQICILLSDVFAFLDNIEMSYSYSLIAFEVAEQYHYKEFSTRIASRFGRYYFKTGNIRKALALDLAHIHTDKGASYINTLINIGVYLDVLGYQGYALQCYFEGVHHLQSLNSTMNDDAFLRNSAFNLYYNICLILLDKSDIMQLRHYFDLLNSITERYTFTVRNMTYWAIMKAQLHIFENRYDEAEEFLRHFLQETDLSDYPRIRGTFFSTFSKIELCKHNFESATTLMNSALEHLSTPGDPSTYISLLNESAKTLIKLREIERAKSYAQRALEMTHKSGMIKHAIETNTILLEIAKLEYDNSTELELYRIIDDLKKGLESSGDEQLYKTALIHAAMVSEHNQYKSLQESYSKLEQEYHKKNVELQTLSLQIIHTNKLMESIDKNLHQWNPDNIDTDFLQSTVHAYLQQSSKIEWDMYQKHFLMTYPTFTASLTKQYPALSSSEVKVCTLIKSQLTSDNIADILCISRRTVDSHRYNIRKKLGLDANANLYTFFNQF
jgi:DNA-binding CsgD family transcriptional regulator